MKFTKGFSVFFIIAWLLAAGIFNTAVIAGDTYNQAVATASAADEDKPFITYQGDQEFAADSTGNFYTKAFEIANSNQDGTEIQVWCKNVAGTEDVNVFIQYSNDNASASFVPADTIDQVQTTVKFNIVGGVRDSTGALVQSSVINRFHNMRYMRLVFDGQSGNPAATILYWRITMRKNDGFTGKAYKAISTY